MSRHRTLGGPSFHPLYESNRSASFPETPTWTAGEHAPAWTDVFVDFRLPHSRGPVPATLGTPDVEWASRIEGWSMQGWALLPDADPMAGLTMVHQDGTEERVPADMDSFSVLRICDPDGFTFTLAVSADKPNCEPRFSGGRFAFLLPTMRVLLSHCQGHEDEFFLRDAGFAKASMSYSLTSLRDAVKDPHRWFGLPADNDWAALDVGGTFRPIVAARALLAWAAAGATSYADVRDWVSVGMDAAEVAEWHDDVQHIGPDEPDEPDETDGTDVQPDTSETTGDPTGDCSDPSPDPIPASEAWTDAEIRTWFARFGGGTKRRKPAIRLREGGLTPEQAFTWQGTLSGTSGPLRHLVDRFEATEWTPQQVQQMRGALVAYERRTNPDWWMTSCGVAEVSEMAFTTPERALAYLAAGFSPTEVMDMEQSGTPVDMDTLDVMAGLLGTPVDTTYF